MTDRFKLKIKETEKTPDGQSREPESAVALDFGEEAVRERYALAKDRLSAFSPAGIAEAAAEYFRELSEFALLAVSEYEAPRADRETNERLYRDMRPEYYAGSYADPAYAVSRLGEGYGQLLSAFYAEFRGLISFAYEKRLKDITVLLETFIQLLNEFEMRAPEAADGAGPAFGSGAAGEAGKTDAAAAAGFPPLKELRDIFYSYVYDYCAEFTEAAVRESLASEANAAKRIITEAELSDLTDRSYLYRFGEWVTETELLTAKRFLALPEEALTHMADAFTGEALQRFCTAEKAVPGAARQKTVCLFLPLGFERLAKKVIENFEAAGIAVIWKRCPLHLVNKGFTDGGNAEPIFCGARNRQYEYDHKNDMALFFGSRLKAEKLQALKNAYAVYHKEASAFLGSVFAEHFAEADAAPQAAPQKKTEQLSLTEHQAHLKRALCRETAALKAAYSPEEKTLRIRIDVPGQAAARRNETGESGGDSAGRPGAHREA